MIFTDTPLLSVVNGNRVCLYHITYQIRTYLVVLMDQRRLYLSMEPIGVSNYLQVGRWAS